MKSSFFLNYEKVKSNESYNPRERYKVDMVFFITLYGINLNISLQWWIISQSMDELFLNW